MSATEARNLYDLLDHQARASGKSIALRTKRAGRWTSTSFREWADASRLVALALLESGIKKGDRVILAASTREEWAMAEVDVDKEWPKEGVRIIEG